jgi:hypothetical protein
MANENAARPRASRDTPSRGPKRTQSGGFGGAARFPEQWRHALRLSSANSMTLMDLRRVLLPFVVIGIAIVGCEERAGSGSSKAEPTPTKASSESPKARAKRKITFTKEGSFAPTFKSESPEIEAFAAGAVIRFDTLSEPFRWQIGDKKGEVKEFRDEATIDVRAAVFARSFADIAKDHGVELGKEVLDLSQPTVGVSYHVSLENDSYEGSFDYTPGSGSLKLSDSLVFGQPNPIANEAAERAADPSMIVFTYDGFGAYLVGKAKTFAEVDYLASADHKKGRVLTKQPCVYTGGATMTYEVHEIDVEVADRRTGAHVTTLHVSGKTPECKGSQSFGDNKNITEAADIDSADLVAKLTPQLRTLK